MADLTGPISKDVHSGGQTFTPKLKANVGSMKGLSNSSEEARRTIMGMKYRGLGGTSFPTNVESVMTRKPKEG